MDRCRKHRFPLGAAALSCQTFRMLVYGLITASRPTSGPFAAMHGRYLRVALGVVSFTTVLLCAGAAPAQELYDDVLSEVAQLDGIRVRVVVTADGDCTVSGPVLAAEAERALRRDGIPLAGRNEHASAILYVEATLVAVNRSHCAASYEVQLIYFVGSWPVLAAAGGGVLSWSRTGVEDEVRSNVEKFVSVIANALAKERDGR